MSESNSSTTFIRLEWNLPHITNTKVAAVMEETVTIFNMLDADELIITGADALSVVATEETEVLELTVGMILGVES